MVQTALVALGLILFISTGTVLRADPPAVVNSLPNTALDQTDSFMGMHVGDQVRLKCTEPEIELNNAKLLAITKTTVVVSSTTGERYTLLKEATTFEPPVNWKRTTSVFDDKPNRSSHRGGGWFLLLLILVGAGAGGWFWFVRQREPESETTIKGLTVKGTTSVTKGTTSVGKFKLSPIATRSELVAAPASSANEGFDSDSVEDLIEGRRYGTAIERLEQQIKTAPDDFKLRLQLLKVYSIVSNRKQLDRVMHQIEFHPAFSPEQKREAAQILTSSKEKESTAGHATTIQSVSAPSPTTQPAAIPSLEAQPANSHTENTQPDTAPAAPAAPPAPPAPPPPTEAQIRAAQMKATQVRIAQQAIAEAAAAHAAAQKAKAAQAAQAAHAAPPPTQSAPTAQPVPAPEAKPAVTETAVNQVESESDETPAAKSARRAGPTTRKSTRSRQKNSA